MKPDLLLMLGMPADATDAEVETAFLGASQVWRQRRLGASDAVARQEAEGQERRLAEAYGVWKRELTKAPEPGGASGLPASTRVGQALVETLSDHEADLSEAEDHAQDTTNPETADETLVARRPWQPIGGESASDPKATLATDPGPWRSGRFVGPLLVGGLLLCLVAGWFLSRPHSGSHSAPLPEIHFTALRIAHGTFQMGSPSNESGRYSDETLHQVTLTRDFLMLATEVTQAQWQALMGNNPSSLARDANRPVETVGWYDALAYANVLSEADGLPEAYNLSSCSGTPGGGNYSCGSVTLTAATPYATTGWRLPTEAEWEYAYRAGTSTPWFSGADEEQLSLHAWIFDNSGGQPHPVAQKQPNAWGLFDMAGNVPEWCWDWDGDYPGAVTDPTGPTSGWSRVYRGGSWNSGATSARAAHRSGNDPDNLRVVYDLVGFRLVRTDTSVPVHVHEEHDATRGLTGTRSSQRKADH